MSAIDNENAIESGLIQPKDSCRHFLVAEIVIATNNFDDDLVIGVGGFGKVYIGTIDSGATTVAIKRLNAESKQGAEEFWTEVKMLSKLRHNHLVALVGYCKDSEEMILVYEYISQGTLADHLYKRNRKESVNNYPINWEERLEICIAAARGLDYLHIGTTQSFIHRDVKTTNILLDEIWVAKISDFGLCKGTTSHFTTHVSTNVKGTFGYLDPDYFYTCRLTKKSDVFAFGVVLLEVLCGRPAVDSTLDEEETSLILWAKKWFKKGKLDRIIDNALTGQISPHSLKYFARVTYNCLQTSPKTRPTMAEVMGSLDLALASQRKGRAEGAFTNLLRCFGLMLYTSAECTRVAERHLLADTSMIVEKNKACYRMDLRSVVTDGLFLRGYDASICKSRWDKSSSYPGGEHEYIVVIVGGERLLIAIDFISEFEIARPTGSYEKILRSLPYIFVGRTGRLEQIISTVTEAWGDSFKKQGIRVPPWRKAEFVRAKWLSQPPLLSKTTPSNGPNLRRRRTVRRQRIGRSRTVSAESWN